MSYRIAFNFEDGVTRFIDCNAGEKVLAVNRATMTSATTMSRTR